MPSSTSWSASGMLFVWLLFPAGCGTEREGDDAGECADDADNDRDGLFDCDDSDCAGAEACSEPGDTDTDAVATDDADHDGYSVDQGDCDDTDPNLSPAEPEACDGVDNDCDNVVDDDATDATTFYADTDGDGFGDPSAPVLACFLPDGASATSDDCDDSDSEAKPGGLEVCDGSDEDCDGVIDDDSVCPVPVRWNDDPSSASYGNAYLFVNNRTSSWGDQQGYCRDWGYELIKVEDELEWHWVESVIERDFTLHSEYVDDIWWVGYHSPAGDANDPLNWRWWDMTAGGYVPWFGDYPDTIKPCALTHRTTFSPFTLMFFSLACDGNEKVICESSG